MGSRGSLRKILLVHLGGGLGDLLLSTVLFSQLKRCCGDPHIAVMVKKGTAGILSGHPFLDEIIEVDSDALKGPCRFSRQVKALAARKFDGAVALWSTASVAWLLACAGIPVRVGQGSRLLYSFLYTHKVSVRSEKGDVTSHWVECLLDYIRVLGCDIINPEVIMTVEESDKKRARELLEQKGWSGEPLWGLHAGKGLALDERRWPVDYFARLADGLIAELGGTLVLTGGSGEMAIVASVQQAMKKKAFNVAGATTIKELAAITSFCSAFICPDSAPMHIAAAMKVPTVGIFALKSDFPHRWGPYGTRSEVIIPPDVPCARKCIKERCPRYDCYESVAVESVVAAVKRLTGKP